MILSIFTQIAFGGCDLLGAADSWQLFGTQPVQLLHQPSERCAGKKAHSTPRFYAIYCVSCVVKQGSREAWPPLLSRVAQFFNAVGEQDVRGLLVAPYCSALTPW